MLRALAMGAMLLRWCVAMAALCALPAPAYDFLGAESCQSCHADAYAAWKASPHARAKEVLSVTQQRDARCLSCHSPNETEQKQVGVTCETCHGGGQYYSPRYVMKDPELARLAGLTDPTEKSCRFCHDASSPSLKPFDFVSKLKLMDHWTTEREKRKRPKAALDRSPTPFRTLARWSQLSSPRSTPVSSESARPW